MSPQSTVSLIIPVCNGESTIAQCLDSIMALDYPKEDLEIILSARAEDIRYKASLWIRHHILPMCCLY